MPSSPSARLLAAIRELTRVAHDHLRDVLEAGESFWSEFEMLFEVHELRRRDSVAQRLRVLEFAKKKALESGLEVPGDVLLNPEWTVSLGFMKARHQRKADLSSVSAVDVQVQAWKDAAPDDLTDLGYGHIDEDDLDRVLRSRLDPSARTPSTMDVGQFFYGRIPDVLSDAMKPRTLTEWWTVCVLVLTIEALEFDSASLGIPQPLAVHERHSTEEDWRRSLYRHSAVSDSEGARLDRYLELVEAAVVKLSDLTAGRSARTTTARSEESVAGKDKSGSGGDALLKQPSSESLGDEIEADPAQRIRSSGDSRTSRRRRTERQPPKGWFWLREVREKFDIPRSTADTWTRNWSAADRFRDEDIRAVRLRTKAFEKEMRRRQR